MPREVPEGILGEICVGFPEGIPYKLRRISWMNPGKILKEIIVEIPKQISGEISSKFDVGIQM